MSEIFKGHDCSKRAGRPTLTLRLEKREILAEPNELITLKLLDVHPDCFPSCYQWAIRFGGGRLIDPYGTVVKYVAPEDNKNCENDAVVDVLTGSKWLDSAYISVNRYRRKLCTGGKPYTPLSPPIAYRQTGTVIYGEPHTGTKVTLPDGKVRLADEYLEAYYLTRYYDCRGLLCWVRHMPRLHWWGINPPAAMLRAKFGHLAGEFRDLRGKDMKKQECCSPRALRVKMETEEAQILERIKDLAEEKW